MPDVRKVLSLPELIGLADRHAHKIFIEQRLKRMTPILHLIDRNGRSIIVVCNWTSDIQKQIILLDAKKRSHEMGAVAAMFMSEIWMYPHDERLATRAEAERLYRLCPPSQHPRRREAVLAVATHDGKHFEQAVWQMLRDNPGRVVSLVRIEEHAVVSDGSIFHGLIPDPSEQPRTYH
jgi:hypothetical protein